MENNNTKKPIVLVILDGWGEWEIEKGNPIKKAKLPTIESLDKHFPKTLLQASGLAVGLPWNIRGNSEVGHQTIGSGQIIGQFLPAINASIGDGSFFNNETLVKTFNEAKTNGKAVHLLGLLSDGGVHSHIDHLLALLDMAKKYGVKNIFIHAITDGRDTHPQSAKNFISIIESKIAEIGFGKIATLCGRYYAMDRNNNWDRIQKYFSALTQGEGIKEKKSSEAVDNQYAKKIFDEYLEPVVLTNEAGEPIGIINNDDAVICFNFRKDRSRQIIKSFVTPDFQEFKAEKKPKINCACFVLYEENLPVEVCFKPEEITVRLGEVISKAGKKQLRIAETEKYAHVTYFFNGGVETPYEGEDRTLILSKKVTTYAEIPEMSAGEVTEKLLAAIASAKYDFILVNYANSDMVGHTGDFLAAVKALEYMDVCLDKLINTVLKVGGELIITADHGNVEEMINVHTGEIDTQHSKNPVPCWYVSKESFSDDEKENKKLTVDGMLVDLAPTVLDLMGMPKPKEMVGKSLMELLRVEK